MNGTTKREERGRRWTLHDGFRVPLSSSLDCDSVAEGDPEFVAAAAEVRQDRKYSAGHTAKLAEDPVKYRVTSGLWEYDRYTCGHKI